MNSKWLWGAIVLLIILNVLTLFRLRSIQSKANSLQISNKNTTNKLKVSDQNTITRSGLEKRTELQSLPLDIPLINVAAEDTTTIESLVGGTPKLVFRYSELNCMQCVDQEVANIKSLAQEIGKEHIIIAATYDSIRDLFLFKRINNLEFPVYKLPDEGFRLPLDQANVPFLFMIDEEFQSKLVFVPEKNLPSMSEQYYDIIKSRFFN